MAFWYGDGSGGGMGGGGGGMGGGMMGGMMGGGMMGEGGNFAGQGKGAWGDMAQTAQAQGSWDASQGSWDAASQGAWDASSQGAWDDAAGSWDASGNSGWSAGGGGGGAAAAAGAAGAGGAAGSGLSKEEMMMTMMKMMMSIMAEGKGKGKASKVSGWDSSYGPSKGGGGGGKGCSPYNTAFQHVQPASPQEVEAFLAMHMVEQHAADKLRSLDPRMARVVIMKGSMQDARDQTAVLMQRCTGFSTMKDGDWICPGCYDHQFAKNSTCRKCGTDKGNVPVATNTSSSGFGLTDGSAKNSGKHFVTPDNSAFQHVQPATAEQIEAFLAVHQVEQHAADKLRNLDRKLANVVIMKGTMQDARDQTAVLIQRCTGFSSLKDGDWICPGCYDHQFAKNDICRKCGTMKGGVPVATGTTSRSAGLIDGSGKGGWGGSQGGGNVGWGPAMGALAHVEPATEEEVEAFLAMHVVEPHAAEKLRKLDRKLAKVVIMKGSMQDARDQTAVLMQRCSGFGSLKDGDWICPGCFDHQFAKNEMCRKCGTPKSAATITSAPSPCSSAFDVVEAATPEEVDAFLAAHPDLQYHAAEKLACLDPRMQKVIINQGSLADARNSTAVLLQRCSAMETMKLGDWICPGCYDHQFAKNFNCRRCGAAKP